MLFPTCQLYPCDRTLPIFRKFYQPSRNIVTETFAEPAEYWKVSSKQICTGRIILPSLPFNVCLISDSLFNVQFSTCQFYPSRFDVARLPLENSANLRGILWKKTFQSYASINYQSNDNRLITQIIKLTWWSKGITFVGRIKTRDVRSNGQIFFSHRFTHFRTTAKSCRG